MERVVKWKVYPGQPKYSVYVERWWQSHEPVFFFPPLLAQRLIAVLDDVDVV